MAIPFTPLWQCLSEETLKAVGPVYLVSMPGKVKYCELHHSRDPATRNDFVNDIVHDPIVDDGI